MKTKNGILNALIIVSMFAIVLGGCKKKEKEDKDTQSAQDNEQMESMTNDISNIADAAAAGVSSFRVGGGMETLSSMSPCATVTRDTLNSADPDTITIDFGPTNCLCADNRNRRGIVKIVKTGWYFVAGSFRTITFQDFYVNDKHVEGVHTVTANGNASGHYTWTVNAQNMKITRPDGLFVTWNSTRTRTMIAGDTTPFLPGDDVYEITGSADGVNIHGVAFTAVITVPLRRAVACHWIDTGTITVTPATGQVRTLDFGTGACDNQATVTVGSTTVNITLH